MLYFSDCEYALYHEIIIAFQIVIIYSYPFPTYICTNNKVDNLTNHFFNQFKLPQRKAIKLENLLFVCWQLTNQIVDK